MKLKKKYFQDNDTLTIAKNLIGKVLYSNIDGEICSGIIVETEAYMGPHDKGSHSYNSKRTPRNEVMYEDGGLVYIYICYGMHQMMNIVTGDKNEPHAILIRALEPLQGIEIMRERRKIFNQDDLLCRGPGSLCKSMGIHKSHNAISISGDIIWIEDQKLPTGNIIETKRIGLNIDEPYLSIPWRFLLEGNKNVSLPRR